MWDPYGNAGANTGTPPPLSHPGPGEGEAQGTTRCMAEVRPRPLTAKSPLPGLQPQPETRVPRSIPRVPRDCIPRGWLAGRGRRDAAGGVGVTLTRSRGSRDSGGRPRVAAVALGTRRRHRQRQRDETSRMPTSGATRRTELGRSSKSSLGEEMGTGGFGGGPFTSDHVTGPPGTRETLTW